MNSILVYFIISILYAFFGAYVQRTVSRYKRNNSYTIVLLVFLINFIGFPVCLIISLFNRSPYIIVYRRIKRYLKNKLKK